MLNELYFLPDTGESSLLIRSLDWDKNPLGQPAFWPIQLKTAVQMMLASRFPKAIVWGEHYITLYNDAFSEILGEKHSVMGQPFDVIWKESWNEIGTIVEKAFRGEATYIEEFPLAINRYGYSEQCYFTFCYSPILDEEGKVLGMIDTVIEMTAKVEAVKNAAVLNSELAHRIKNTFSVVQALATQTFKRRNINEALPVFVRRLHALASANDVLRLGATSNGTVQQIVEAVIFALGVQNRINISGKPIMIGPKAAMSTSLLIHELTTNAMKYGALSNDQGYVDLSWKITLENSVQLLQLEWTERDGPSVIMPETKGFGSRLIRMGLSGSGGSDMTFNPEGIQAIFTAPLQQVQQEGRLYSSGRRSSECKPTRQEIQP
ncbi:HWE histidine kinase domain-containing protein [Pseudochrobactrum sp. MP213Fo]|uniref:PAS domain-containing sensor histidine kinase n=1 Tax=Pseudochrobactrum sp. MP213Fo TaxID=3022250 RepID=UPI003B9DD8BC